MVTPQTSRVSKRERRVQHQGESDALLRPPRQRSAEADVVLVSVELDVRRGESDEQECQERGGSDVRVEIAVVPPAYTIVEPDAVVVLGFDAAVANAAVVGAGRAPDLAAFAVFGGDFHCCCLLLLAGFGVRKGFVGGEGADHDPGCCGWADG